MQEKEIKNKSGNNKANGNTAADNKDDNITVPKTEYDALKSRAEERDLYYEKYVMAHAEFENARKRMEKERADLLKYASESLLLEFLPIVDNLEIAEKHIEEAKDFKAVQEGVDMIQQQILKFLKDVGIERIKTVGEKFDPHVHEPIETEESKDKDDGLILAELKPGYRLNGKLLRPAAVKIVKNKG